MSTAPPFPQYFDSSMVSAALSCERQFWWHYMRALVPKAESIHLIAGGAFASGIEAYRHAFYARGCDHTASMTAAFRAVVKSWGDYEPPFETNKARHRVLEALDIYFTEWWPAATDTLQPHRRADGTPSIEFSFAIPLPDCEHPATGEPLFYVGRLDMLGIYNKQLFVVDEKTTSQMGASWVQNWDLRGQFTGYIWAVKTLLNLPVVGAVIRGVAFRKHDLDHAEVITYRAAYQVDEWLRRTTAVIRRLATAYREGYWLPNYDSACTQYGGCSYLTLCTKGDPEPWAAADYVENRWDPLKHAGVSP